MRTLCGDRIRITRHVRLVVTAGYRGRLDDAVGSIGL